MNAEKAALMTGSPILRAVLAFGSIWLVLLLIPAAREIVGGQMQALPGALRRQLPIGLLCGGLLVALDVVLLRRLGAVEVGGVRWTAPALLLGTLLFIAFLALTEEMIFRGVLYTRLEQRAGGAAAVLITALLFCVFHFIGRPFVWEKSLEYFLDGLFLAGLVWWTRDLWTAVGWHLAKNVAVAETFGGSYRLSEPLLEVHNVPWGRSGMAAAHLADLTAFAVSVGLCLALLWLTRRGR